MNTNKIEWSFTGRYAMQAENLANGAMNYFACNEDQAKRFGMAFMADYGNRKKETENDGITLRFGKLDKDGNIKIT